MIIDEHRHIGYADASRPARMTADILRDLDELQVDHAVIAPGQPWPGRMTPDADAVSKLDVFRVGEDCLRTGTVTAEVELLRRQRVDHSEVFDAVSSSGGRLSGCWFLNPWLRETAFAQARAAVREHGFKYIKLHTVCHAFAADDEAVMAPVMDMAVELDVPVWFHTSYGPGCEARRVVDIAARFPGTNVILGHVCCGLDLDAVAWVAQAAVKYSNLWIDLAESRLNQIQLVVQAAPADRLLMASDDPWGIPLEEHGLAAMMAKARTATQDNENLRRKMMGENAARLLKIE